MFNTRWGIIPAGAAFILSLAVGLLSGTSLSLVIFRALLFAAVFFVIGAGAWYVISHYLPELLEAADSRGENNSGQAPGSRINITLEDAQNAALPEKYGDSGDEKVGDIADLSEVTRQAESSAALSAGMDQNARNGYNNSGVLPELDGAAEGDFSGPGGNTDNPVSAGGIGALPDLDAFTGVFSDDGEDSPQPAEGGAAAPERKPVGNKPEKFEGDFSPKEIAAGIRTILEKDDKG